MADETPPSDRPGTDAALEQRAQRLRARAREGRSLSRDDYRTHTRRSLLTGAAGLVAAGLGWRALLGQERVDGLQATLRRGHELTADLWRAVPTPTSMAREFPLAAAEDLQLNGGIGLDDEVDLETWSMRVLDPDGQVLDELVLADLDDLEQVEMVTEHKCIEGWSQVAHWGGVRFSDFAQRYADRVGDAGFVGLVTPDEEYYVGLTREAMLHPQTLLAHTLGGEPLTQNHGAPLRLVSPNHYGIKSLKRIATIQFANQRPADYWAERTYDWNSEL